MPRIVIENMQGKTIDCPDQNEKVLDILLREVDWMHACGGKGRCTTCKVIILKGLEEIEPMSETELKFYNINRLAANERLSCQINLRSDLVVRVAEQNKLPHISYSK